jgi:hypothetical protein
VILKLDGFGNKTPRGDWLAICSLKQGARLDVQGTILNVASASTKYLLFVNSSVRRMKPAFAGKCMDVSVARVKSAAGPVRVWRRFSFPNKSRGKCPGFGERKIRAGRRTTFGMGFVIPSVILLPTSRSWAFAALSHGGRNRGVFAASSIPQGVHGSNHNHSSLVVYGTD